MTWSHGEAAPDNRLPPQERVPMRLAGEDGNAFAILGRFQRAARAAGWSPDEIAAVRREATSDDYNHLVAVIAGVTSDPEYDDD